MGKAATRAQNKYIKSKYDRINLVVLQGEKQKYQQAAQAAGKSLNAWIVEAMEEKRENKR